MPGIIEFNNSASLTAPSPGVILTGDTSFNSTTGIYTIGPFPTCTVTNGTASTAIYTTTTSLISDVALPFTNATGYAIQQSINATLSNGIATTSINITTGIDMAYSDAAWTALVRAQAARGATGTTVGNVISVTTGAANDTITSVMAAWTIMVNQVHQKHLTEEEQARLVEQQRQAQERYAQQQREASQRKEAANDRAERLLRGALTPEQVAELEQKRFFTLQVYSKTGERKLYRIQRGRSGNVKQVDESGRVIKTLCAHPIANVPDADTMLAQKLMLESEEEIFLRIANHS